MPEDTAQNLFQWDKSPEMQRPLKGPGLNCWLDGLHGCESILTALLVAQHSAQQGFHLLGFLLVVFVLVYFIFLSPLHFPSHLV